MLRLSVLVIGDSILHYWRTSRCLHNQMTGFPSLDPPNSWLLAWPPLLYCSAFLRGNKERCRCPIAFKVHHHGRLASSFVTAIFVSSLFRVPSPECERIWRLIREVEYCSKSCSLHACSRPRISASTGRWSWSISTTLPMSMFMSYTRSEVWAFAQKIILLARLKPFSVSEKTSWRQSPFRRSYHPYRRF